ncbi:MAG: hypothetical protein IH587_13145, partial [Anaerolineae bacterium]|nr:hypothetical protein [Anaerolineae bacterium]
MKCTRFVSFSPTAIAGAFLALPSISMATLVGPTPYLCFDTTNSNSSYEATYSGSCGTSGSPWAADAIAGNFTYFHLENFQDLLLNAGVSASSGTAYGGTITDSVDADDGVIDGSGSEPGGKSFFSSAGSTSFTFDGTALGGLPTHVGIVWTDGGGGSTFRAYDETGVELAGGPLTSNSADARVDGTTVDDVFYGAINSGGISLIFISSLSGGIEVDHLQYGLWGGDDGGSGG